LTCLPDYTIWPHKTTCTTLAAEGELCQEDWDCV